MRVVLVRLANIERMKLMYAPELATLPAAPRDQLLIALAALTSFESWDQMRNCHNLLQKPRKQCGGPRSTGCCRDVNLPSSRPEPSVAPA